MTDELDRIKQKVERTNKHSFFTFLVFLVISTAAWFLVKLSEDYVTQTIFRVLMEEVPADKWVSSDEQSVKMSLTIDGFHTLRYKMLPEAKHVVTLSLDEVSYKNHCIMYVFFLHSRIPLFLVLRTY